MVGLRRTLLAAVLGTAMISRPAVAQHGSSSSLTHTVTVTVPPRVKIQVAAFAPSAASTVKVGSVNPTTQGLTLNVNATRAWVVSIASSSSGTRTSPVRWSLEPSTGFSRLTSSHVRIASGAIAGESGTATVFFRNTIDAASADQPDHNALPVVLTISAP